MASRRERRNQRHEVALLEPIIERVDDEEEKKVEKHFDSDTASEDARASNENAAMHDSEDESEEDEHRVTFASVNDLHKGCYVMMKGGFPCKVVEVARSKQGKH